MATRVPSASGMRAYSAWVPISTHQLAVDARALVAGPADLAGVVGGEERPDHELARLDRRDVGADGFDDADVLVTHRCRSAVVVGSPVWPQIRAAHAGRREANDRVGGFDDGGVVALLEADVVGAVQDCTSHVGSPSNRLSEPLTGQSMRCDDIHSTSGSTRVEVPVETCTSRAPHGRRQAPTLGDREWSQRSS